MESGFFFSKVSWFANSLKKILLSNVAWGKIRVGVINTEIPYAS